MHKEVLSIIESMLQEGHYGEVSIKIQDGKIIDVMKTQRIRIATK